MARVLLIGASGLVGSAVLRRAAQQGGGGLSALVRRPLGDAAPTVTEIVAPVGDWPGIVRDIAPCILVSTLGTTIRTAGSQASFRAIDYDVTLAVAVAACAAGTSQMIVVSSVGADAASRSFYLRTKGDVETALAAVGFARLDIMRPGLLRGDRQGAARPAERAAMMLSPLTDVLTLRAFDRYRSIAAVDVAAAIHALVGAGGSGVHIHHNRAMLALAAG